MSTKTTRQGKHLPDKRLVSIYATQEERTLFKDAAKLAGFPTVSDYLRWVARAQPRPGQLPESRELNNSKE